MRNPTEEQTFAIDGAGNAFIVIHFQHTGPQTIVVEGRRLPDSTVYALSPVDWVFLGIACMEAGKLDALQVIRRDETKSFTDFLDGPNGEIDITKLAQWLNSKFDGMKEQLQSLCNEDLRKRWQVADGQSGHLAAGVEFIHDLVNDRIFKLLCDHFELKRLSDAAMAKRLEPPTTNESAKKASTKKAKLDGKGCGDIKAFFKVLDK